MQRARLALAAAAAAVVLPVTAASAKDYAGTALNIVPSGQYGGIPVPSDADQQAKMYDGLTPLFDKVAPGDLTTYFKSERFGVDNAGPAQAEKVPRKNVRIVRDRYHVPHITGKTHDDVVWATGWVLEEDRGLLLAQGRYPARLAAVDAPGIDAFSLVTGLKTFTPTKQADRWIDQQETAALKGAGAKGRALLHDIDVYIAGINARLKFEKSKQKPWTRVDVYAINGLLGQIFGQGGGDESRRSALLDGLRKRLGRAKGDQVFDDLSSQNDADTPATISTSFPYEKVPAAQAGNLPIDSGSMTKATARKATVAGTTRHYMSNFLMVGAKRSTTGHPLFVAGPQIGYFYPGLTLEMDLHGGGLDTRGVSAPGFPGDMLIGRGPDYAWSLTSAGNDLIDQFVETLCGGSTQKYLYKGKCRSMGHFDAGTIQGQGPVKFLTTIHGPVLGYATSNGKKVAISSQRASRGRDVLFQLTFHDLSNAKVKDVKSFYKAVAQSPFTFNVPYVDSKHIAVFSAGRLPVRNPQVDPRLPTNGNGKYEWRGFLSADRHPHQADPSDGILVNWNNKPAKGFGSADDEWSYGSIQRVQMLRAGLEKTSKNDLASVVGAMNAAATQDIRDLLVLPSIAKVLQTGPAPDARAQRMLDLLLAWRASGASRLDRDLDGKIDDPGAAIMDAAWPRIGDAVLGPVLGPQLAELTALGGRNVGPGSGFTGSWLGYVDKDLKDVAGTKVAQPFKTRFCGNGDLNACRDSLWAAFDAAAAGLEAQQDTADPAAWRADATAERISFAPGLMQTKIRYTNRPSGIQQVLSFDGHR